MLEWFVTKWKKAQTKNREENQSSGLLLLQTQALSYENCEAVEKCLMPLSRDSTRGRYSRKIDDVQNQK